MLLVWCLTLLFVALLGFVSWLFVCLFGIWYLCCRFGMVVVYLVLFLIAC